MSRAALAVAACLAFGCADAAVEIRSYQTRLDVADDGAAQARAEVVLTGARAGRVRLPVGFTALSDLRLAPAPPGITIEAGKAGRQAFVDIVVPEGAGADLKLAFEFRVSGVMYQPKPEEGQKSTFPAGSRLLRHAFVNTQEAAIGQYRVTVTLPQADMVHAVREQLPRPGRKEFLPRVELARFDGRQGAQLQTANLRQGDRTSMELEIVAQRRAIGWLLALVPLAIGYLYAFRDTVQAPRAR